MASWQYAWMTDQPYTTIGFSHPQSGLAAELAGVLGVGVFMPQSTEWSISLDRSRVNLGYVSGLLGDRGWEMFSVETRLQPGAMTPAQLQTNWYFKRQGPDKPAGAAMTTAPAMAAAPAAAAPQTSFAPAPAAPAAPEAPAASMSPAAPAAASAPSWQSAPLAADVPAAATTTPSWSPSPASSPAETATPSWSAAPSAPAASSAPAAPAAPEGPDQAPMSGSTTPPPGPQG